MFLSSFADAVRRYHHKRVVFFELREIVKSLQTDVQMTDNKGLGTLRSFALR